MAKETRPLRPFDVMDRTQQLMIDLVRVQSPPIPENHYPPEGSQGLKPLGVTGGSIAAPRGSLNLDDAGYLTNAIGLYFGLNESQWEGFVGIAREEIQELTGNAANPPVSLVVTAHNSRLKQRTILVDLPFKEFANSAAQWRHLIVKATQLDERPRPFRMPKDGAVLLIQFLLTDDINSDARTSGKPWRKGSWLARVKIPVKAKIGRGLSPRPMNEEVRKRFGLGDDSVVYAHFLNGAEGICQAEDLNDIVSFYVDEELLIQATRVKPNGDPVNKFGPALEFQWAMSLYRALVAAIKNDPEFESFDLDEEGSNQTFLTSLIEDVSSSHKGISPEEALNILRSNSERFVSLIESAKRAKEYTGEFIK